MFGLLESIAQDAQDRENRIKYRKYYPFNTSKNQEAPKDWIMVYYVDCGYCVFEHGEKAELLKWFLQLDDAIEFAVDHARERILNYQA